MLPNEISFYHRKMHKMIHFLPPKFSHKMCSLRYRLVGVHVVFVVVFLTRSLSLSLNLFSLLYVPVRACAPHTHTHLIYRQWSKYFLNKSVYQRVTLIHIMKTAKTDACVRMRSRAHHCLFAYALHHTNPPLNRRKTEKKTHTHTPTHKQTLTTL